MTTVTSYFGIITRSAERKAEAAVASIRKDFLFQVTDSAQSPADLTYLIFDL